MRIAAALGAFVVVAFLLRLPSLTDAFFGDELSTHFVVDRNGFGRMMEIVHSEQEVTPPLYYILAWISAHFGDSSDWMRLPSIVSGLALIPLTYLLGKRTVGRQAGIVAAAVVSLSPFLIYYSTEARNYSTSAAIALLSTLALLQAVDEDRNRWWIAYAVLSAAAMYTHYSNLFVLAGQAGWVLLFRPEARVKLLLANAGAVLIYLPWVPGYLEDQRSPGSALIGALQPFTLHVFRVDGLRLVFGSPYMGLSDLPGNVAIAAIWGGLGVGVAGALVKARRLAAWRPSSLLVLLVVLAWAAPVGAAAFSMVDDDVYLSRNLIGSWPAIAVLIGAMVTWAGGPVRIAATALVVAGFAVGAAMMLDTDNQRPDYDGAARYITSEKPSDEVVVDAGFPASATKLALEAALEDEGDERPVIRLGVATLADAQAVRAPDGPGQFHSTPPIAEPGVIAREAVERAGGEPFLLVAPGDFDLDFQTLTLLPLIEGFVDALPDGYHQTDQHNFPGLLGGVTVFEFSR